MLSRLTTFVKSSKGQYLAQRCHLRDSGPRRTLNSLNLASAVDHVLLKPVQAL